MTTLDEIMRNVTPPKEWLDSTLIFSVTQLSKQADANFHFALRAARNFAPLVKALKAAYSELDFVERNVSYKSSAKTIITNVLAEALRKEP